MSLPVDQQNLISSLGLAELPEDRREALLEKAVVLIEKRLLVRIHDSLKTSDRETFKALLEQEDETALVEFLQIHAPRLNDWAREEAEILKHQLSIAAGDL